MLPSVRSSEITQMVSRSLCRFQGKIKQNRHVDRKKDIKSGPPILAAQHVHHSTEKARLSIGKYPFRKEICVLHKFLFTGSAIAPSCKMMTPMVQYSYEEEIPNQRVFQQEEPKKRGNLRRNRRYLTSQMDKPRRRIQIEQEANGKLQNEEPKNGEIKQEDSLGGNSFFRA